MTNTAKPWGSIHPDFKTVKPDGSRWVLILDEATGGTVLVPWEGS